MFEIVYCKRKNAVSMCIITRFVENFPGLYRLCDIQIVCLIKVLIYLADVELSVFIKTDKIVPLMR